MSIFLECVVFNAFKAAIPCGIFSLTLSVLRKRVEPKWQYVMWILVAIRLVTPPIMPTSISFYNLEKFYYLTRMSTEVPRTLSKFSPAAFEILDGVQKALRSGPQNPSSSMIILFLSWITGVIGCLGMIVLRNWRVSTLVRRSGRLVDPRLLTSLERCKSAWGVERSVELVEVYFLNMPALFGFRNPKILLPRGLTDELTLEELELVFHHELVHWKRRDIPLKYTVALIQAIQWFNPLAWFSLSKLEEAREGACDEAVLTRLGKEKSRLYAKTLVKLLSFCGGKNQTVGSVGALNHREPIFERIMAINRFRPPSKIMIFLAIAVFSFTAIAFLTESSLAKSRGVSSPTRQRVLPLDPSLTAFPFPPLSKKNITTP